MQEIRPGDIITFTEYKSSPMTGRRHIRQRMENMIVAAVIQPNEILPKEKIEEYYGEDLLPEECMALSVSPAMRLVLKDDNDRNWHVSLVEDFVKSGMQKIEFGARSAQVQADGPSYLQFMNMYGGTRQ